jgi:inner membrane transporter RhtA
VAWLRIVSAALVLGLWRRPGWPSRATVTWGVLLAVMNCCFYEAIARTPLGTVATIEFLPVVVLAALGARTARNVAAVVMASGGVYLLTGFQLSVRPLGLAFAFANAALFAGYIVLAHRAAQRDAIDGLASAMVVAAVAITPLGLAQAAGAFTDPVALAAGVGVGISSSVIPYVTDQLAMARLSRSTYALMVSLMPAVATAIGLVVLGQIPNMSELAGVLLVAGGVAVHREVDASAGDLHTKSAFEYGRSVGSGKPAEGEA